MFLSTNVYGWTQIAKQKGLEWSIDWGMAQAKSAGLDGWEQSFTDPAQVEETLAAAARAGLSMHSAYIGGGYHEQELAEASAARTLAIAERLASAGINRIICNPDPLPGGVNKTDEQLKRQAASFEAMGEKLKPMGCELLFHSHAPEMRAGAREFHHMLAGTDPTSVGLCLDLHWVYRGAENSEVALMDIIRLYADRIRVLHIRQSIGGVWSETVGPGDLDLEGIARLLESKSVRSLLVLEHAYENGTSSELDPVEAHRRSAAYVANTFARLSAY